ncbi:MAG TPA: hypothetical protein VL326_09845 [Kofleriaceae bacterium]|nr:hypothetical protein [Kofleriaceae bacterium]
MSVYCDFYGSYYDPDPWTHKACAVEYSVPEGCPMHFSTGAPIDLAHVAAKLSSGGSLMDAPSTAMNIGSDQVTFSVMDVNSCDCHQTSIGVEFQHVEVDVPDARAGDIVYLQGTAFESGEYSVEIGPAGPCPTPEWPTEYHAALACDRCPVDGDTNGDGVPDLDNDDVGCAVGGDPSVILVAFALAPLVRRRRAKIVSSE